MPSDARARPLSSLEASPGQWADVLLLVWTLDASPRSMEARGGEGPRDLVSPLLSGSEVPGAAQPRQNPAAGLVPSRC